MTKLRSLTSYPKGGFPPIHIPCLRDAANLSRMRSPDNSRSNCAKLSRIFNISFPDELEVLNDCVTETKLTLCLSKSSTIFEKSNNDRESLSIL